MILDLGHQLHSTCEKEKAVTYSEIKKSILLNTAVDESNHEKIKARWSTAVELKLPSTQFQLKEI